MFYEIQKKRRLSESSTSPSSSPSSSSSVKCWLTVAFLFVSLIAIFAAFVCWLGIAWRQTSDAFASSDFSTDERLTWLKSEFRRYDNDDGVPPSPLPVAYSATPLTPERVAVAPNVRNRKTRTETTPMTETIRQRNIGGDDVYNDLRSRIAQLSSTEENAIKLAENGALSAPPYATKNKTTQPISSQPTPFVLSNTPAAVSTRTYELPDFSQIEPDLSAFNTKMIPAFTYLKEPLPVFDKLKEKENGDEMTYYYSQNADNDSAMKSNRLPEDDSFTSLLKKRLRTVQNWLLYGNGSGRDRNQTIDLVDLSKIWKNSFRGQSLIGVFAKLKNVYNEFNSTEVQKTVSNLLYPINNNTNVLNDSANLVSFGLLAIDLFLLHNVQQIMWNEENVAAMEMTKDPDVLALQALFMSPDRVSQMRQSNSRILNDDDDGRNKNVIVIDLIELINGAFRAVLNLSRAYQSSTSKSIARSSSASTLDCIWTLYCRNLDKTAKVNGPYGFLAKMNSLGLRLMMGDFPIDKALDRFVKEYNEGWTPLDCDKLFPRCGLDEAKEVVIQTALGKIS